MVKLGEAAPSTTLAAVRVRALEVAAAAVTIDMVPRQHQQEEQPKIGLERVLERRLSSLIPLVCAGSVSGSTTEMTESAKENVSKQAQNLFRLTPPFFLSVFFSSSPIQCCLRLNS